jgi:hypothetical protein
MTRTNRIAVIGLLVVVVGLGIFYFAQPACACLTADQAARGRTKSEMRNILYALQTWREEHGRYPGTLEELGYSVDTRIVHARLVAVAESTLTLVATSAEWRGVSCSLEVTPAVGSMDATVCSGSAEE